MIIKFGTDGWRGVITQDFTFENVKMVSQAISDYVGKGKTIAIGYDTRFMSREYAHLVATVLSGNDINTILSESATSTPMLSFFVKHNKLNGGVMITASHNPGIYNGINL